MPGVSHGSRFLVLDTRCNRICERDWAMVIFYVTPFQGYFHYLRSIPRALPWAGMSCPFGASEPNGQTPGGLGDWAPVFPTAVHPQILWKSLLFFIRGAYVFSALLHFWRFSLRRNRDLGMVLTEQNPPGRKHACLLVLPPFFSSGGRQALPPLRCKAPRIQLVRRRPFS